MVCLALLQVREAIEQGVLTWAAFPFNSELGAYDASLLHFGINHTHALDDFFGLPRKHRARAGTRSRPRPASNKQKTPLGGSGYSGYPAATVVRYRVHVSAE